MLRTAAELSIFTASCSSPPRRVLTHGVLSSPLQLYVPLPPPLSAPLPVGAHLNVKRLAGAIPRRPVGAQPEDIPNVVVEQVDRLAVLVVHDVDAVPVEGRLEVRYEPLFRAKIEKQREKTQEKKTLNKIRKKKKE